MAQCMWCPERNTPPFSRKNFPRAGSSLLSPFPQKHSNVTKPTQSCRRYVSKKNNRDAISFGLNRELGEDCAFGVEQYHQCYQQQDFTFGQFNKKWGQNWPVLWEISTHSSSTECLGPWKIPIKNITVKFGYISLNHLWHVLQNKKEVPELVLCFKPTFRVWFYILLPF